MRSQLTLLSLAVLLSFAATADGLKVPPGFEALLEGQEEQLDVKFGGRSLGLFTVEVKPDTVQFKDPVSVLAAIGTERIPEQERVPLEQALNQPLARNGNLACNGSSFPGCGYVKTDTVAAILDETQGAVLLFFNPAWIAATLPNERFHSLTPQAYNAFIHRQTFNYSGDKNSQNLTFNGAGALGLGEDRYLGGDWAYAWNQVDSYQNNQFWFGNLYARQDLGQRYYLQGGRMDQRNLSGQLGGNFGFSMLPLDRFNGVRVGTTAAYVNFNVSQDATPLMVQTNRNARIDIYRGSQLLGSQYLPAGLNAINSDSFPGGSYQIELRVYEDGVLQRTEQYPFSKSGSGFSNGLQWFLQGGSLDTGNNGTGGVKNKAVAAGGIQFGLLPNTQFTTGVSMANTHVYSESRLDVQQPLSFGVLGVNGSYFTGNDGVRGDTQQVTFTDGFQLSLYRYNAGGSTCSKAQSDSPVNTGCYTSLNTTLSVPVADWTATIGYSEVKNKGRTFWSSTAQDALSPGQPYRVKGSRTKAWQIAANRAFNVRGISVSARGGAYRNTNTGVNDNGVFLGFSLSRASQPPAASGHDSYSSAGIDYRSGTASQTNYNLNHTMMWQQGLYRELGVNFSGDKSSNYTGGLSGRVTGRYGDLTGTLSENHSKGYGSRTSATAGYSSALAVSREGIFMGGGGGGEPAAGIAVRVGKSDENAGDAANVRGSSYRPVMLAFGDSTLMLTEGYQMASVDVQDVTNVRSGIASVAQGGGPGNYFMTPGHLVVRDVNAVVTWIYLGRALSPAGRPLAHAQVLNQPLPELGDDGRFTLQSNGKVNALWLIDNGQLLRCPLNIKKTRDVLKLVGDVHCTNAGVEGLPQSLRMTPRVIRLLALAQR